MSHANAALTPRARLHLARLIVEDHYRLSDAAKMHNVSTVTARKWAARYRTEGKPGLQDRSSRPATSPTKTTIPVMKQIVKLRLRRRLGPVQIGDQLGLAASTVHAVLTRCRIQRLDRIDRHTAEPPRRYEHHHPGSMLHVDVTKFGQIPDGGGHRFLGRQHGDANSRTTSRTTSRTAGDPEPQQPMRRRVGTAFVHTVIDDYSRVAYAEICSDEKANTAIGVLRRAVAWFADQGVTVERVLSDNGSCYRSRDWLNTCTELNITAKKTRPYRPQTNGKVERFHRTLADGWAYARLYLSETERRTALPDWLHFYNHHRTHSAVGGPPITRLNNLPGHHS